MRLAQKTAMRIERKIAAEFDLSVLDEIECAADGGRNRPPSAFFDAFPERFRARRGPNVCTGYEKGA